MIRLRTLGLACLAALVSAVAPRAVAAQQHVSVDFRGGIGIPTGDIGNVEKIGPAFTIGVDIGVQSRIAIRASGGADVLKGSTLSNGNVAPNFTLTHLNGGVLFHLMSPTSESRFKADLNVGGGITIMTSTRGEYSVIINGTAGTEIVDYSKIYPAVNAGLTLSYALAPQADVFVSGQGNMTFAKQDDPNSTALSLIAPEATTLKNVLTFPVTVGLRLNFQP